MSTATCPNCGTAITGRYCSGCGQRVADVRVSVSGLIRDLLEDQFSLNSALPRTMPALLFKPGFLTTEYFSQRIARYIAPFRLYLLSTVVLFLVLLFMAQRELDIDIGELEADSAGVAVPDRGAAGRVPGDTARDFYFGLRRDTTVRGLRVDMQGVTPRENWVERGNVKINTGNKLLDEAVRVRLHALGELPPQEAIRRLLAEAVRNTPKVMFVLVPIFALILKLLYARQKRYYVEHFVFALHVHSFVFVVILLMILVRYVHDAAVALLLLWMPVYLFLAMKRMYAQSWTWTFLKWAALSWTYMIVLAFGVLAVFVSAVFTA